MHYKERTFNVWLNLCSETITPFIPPSHKQQSRYNIFIYYISWIMWCQKWSGVHSDPEHTGLLCRRQWARPECNWERQAGSPSCWQLPAELAGPGAPGMLSLGHLILSLHMDSFLTPCLCRYNHKFHWNSLTWAPWSPAQGVGTKPWMFWTFWRMRKVWPFITYITSASGDVQWDRCWVIPAHQCLGVLRGREGDRVCLADGGC